MTVADLIGPYPELRDAHLLRELDVHVDDPYVSPSDRYSGRISAVTENTVTLDWVYEDRNGYLIGDHSIDYPAADVTVCDDETAQQWIADTLADREYDASLVAS